MSGIFLIVLALIAAGGLFISWLSSGPEPASLFSRRIIKYPGFFFLSVLTIFAIYAFIHSVFMFNSDKIRTFTFKDRAEFERMARQSPELFPNDEYVYEFGIPRYQKSNYLPGKYCLVAVNRPAFPPVVYFEIPQSFRFSNKLICSELFGGEFGVLFTDGDAVTTTKYLIAIFHTPIIGYYTTLAFAYVLFAMSLLFRRKTSQGLWCFTKYGLISSTLVAFFMAVSSWALNTFSPF